MIVTNTVSEYFSDEELEDSLRMMFEYDEMFDIDFRTVFNQIKDLDEDYFELSFRGRLFNIDKITGGVIEVEPNG